MSYKFLNEDGNTNLTPFQFFFEPPVMVVVTYLDNKNNVISELQVKGVCYNDGTPEDYTYMYKNYDNITNEIANYTASYIKRVS